MCTKVLPPSVRGATGGVTALAICPARSDVSLRSALSVMRATLNHSGVSMKIADMKLTMAGQEQGLEILREENAQLRAALERFVTAAKSWHNFHHGSQTVQCDWLCECIAPGERALAGIPEQGSSAAECEAHNLEVAGATPAPASIQAPIVRVTINDQYEISSCAQYAPGLPPGDHDLYCEPGGFGSNSGAAK